MRLKGKRALVTGGASGIGYAIAERFLDEGALVAVCDVNAEGCRSAAVELSAKGKVCGIVGDVSNSNDAQRIVREAVEFLGGLDVLVNNAGIDVKGNVVDISEEDWERRLRVNVGSVFRMSKYALPAMMKSGGGNVVNIGSIAAFLGFTGLAAYGTSKGAVVQLTRNMAADLARYNIRVNSVNPGVVDTPLLEHACKAQAGENWRVLKQAYVDAQLLKRVAKPAEIASAVLFLASDDASFVTGTALMVDGGFAIQE